MQSEIPENRPGAAIPADRAEINPPLDRVKDDAAGFPRPPDAPHESLLATAAPEEAWQRFELLFAHSPEGIVEIDLAGNVVRVNDALCQITGYVPDELIGKSFIPFVLPEDQERLARYFQRAIGGDPLVRDATVRHRDGRRIDIRLSSMPITVGGKTVGLWTFAQDITARRVAEHVARGQARSMTRILDTLDGALELDAFLGHVLRVIARQLDARATLLWFHDPATDTVSLHMRCVNSEITCYADKEGDECGEVQPSHERPLWQEIRRTREPLVVPDVREEERIGEREWLVENDIHALLLVPLLAGSDAIGWLTVGVPDYRVFRAEEIELARALAQQVTLAVRLTRLAALNRRGAIVSERYRMAREIHDTLAQGFTGILIQLDAAEELLVSDVQEATSHLVTARELARSSLAEARRSVWALRPLALEHSDLPAALAAMCRRMAADSGVDQQFFVHGKPVPLRPDVEANLLRICIEALNNALKHGRPGKMGVELQYTDEKVTLTVIDNGSGFDTMNAADTGFGLTSMRERADAIGAHFILRSHPGKGTAVVVETPVSLAPDPAPPAARIQEIIGDI